jgi:hypothetical protein
VDGHGDPHAGVAARQLLENEDVREEVRARSAVLLRHADAEEAEFGELREQLARKFVRAIPVGGVRRDLCVGERPGKRLDLPLLGRQLKVHAGQTIGMRAAAILLGVLALAACGGHKPASPEAVARAWSAALDRNDNEAAARLFAGGAQVVQNGVLDLRTHADLVRWTASLPCGGTITSVSQAGADEVLVIFRLTSRPGHACDTPGSDAAAIFRVRAGKIVLWHQTDVPQATDGQPV